MAPLGLGRLWRGLCVVWFAPGRPAEVAKCRHGFVFPRSWRDVGAPVASSFSKPSSRSRRFVLVLSIIARGLWPPFWACSGAEEILQPGGLQANLAVVVFSCPRNLAQVASAKHTTPVLVPPRGSSWHGSVLDRKARSLRKFSCSGETRCSVRHLSEMLALECRPSASS